MRRPFLSQVIIQVVTHSHFLDKKLIMHPARNLHFLSKKFNFNFPRKLSIFLGEKLVKMLWFWTFYLLTTLISREKLSKKNLGEKLVTMLGFCQN